jgi:hypothetical protein
MNTERRFPSLPRWLARVYFAWALFIYIFFDHAWWPAPLYPLIWPLSAVWEHHVDRTVLAWVTPPSGSPTPETFMLYDRIAGGFYLVGGSLWFWLIGYVVSRAATALFPRRAHPSENETNARPPQADQTVHSQVTPPTSK